MASFLCKSKTQPHITSKGSLQLIIFVINFESYEIIIRINSYTISMENLIGQMSADADLNPVKILTGKT